MLSGVASGVARTMADSGLQAAGSSAAAPGSSSAAASAAAPAAAPAAAADDEKEVETIVKALVQYVAWRSVIEAHGSLLRELDTYQRQCWAREERRHNKPGAKSPGEKSRKPRAASPDRPGRKKAPKPKSPAAAPAAATTYATTDIGAAARRLERLSVGGSQQRLSVVGDGRQRRSSAPTAATTAAEPSSYAEALLPAPPPAGRSQFAFEAENPLQMHAASPADRNFQRKLSSLNNLQAETIRLERAQRAANRGGSVPAHLVYKQEMVEAGRWQI